MKRYGKAIQVFLGIIIAGAAMYIFLRGTNIQLLFNELGRITPLSIVVCILLTMLSMVFRCWRWHVMLPDTAGSHKRNLFSHTIIGFMINNIVPARAGEAVRVMLLWRKNGYPLTVSAGSLILDRIIDTMIFLVMFAVPVITVKSLHGLIPAGIIAAGIFTVSAVVLVACGIQPGIISFFVEKCSFVFPGKFKSRFQSIGADAASVFLWIRSPVKALLVLILSMAVWSCSAVSVMILASSYVPFSFWRSTFVLSFAAAGAAIPLAPGFVGTQHAAVLEAFLLLGWNAEAGRAMALLVHASSYLPVTIAGFIYFLKADMSFKEITNADKIIKPEFGS